MKPRPSSRMQPRLFIEETTLIRVRFQEVDSMRIVWHGHYASYFEEARRAFGRRYGLDYSMFAEHQLGAPVVELNIQYLLPALMSDVLKVTARFYRNDTPKLEFGYLIRREAEEPVLARGRTVQVFTTMEGKLIVRKPDFLIRFYQEQEGLWQPE